MNYVGGITGLTQNNPLAITSCSIDAKVYGVKSVAGFVGEASFKLSVSASDFIGDVVASGDQVGGLVGYANSNNYSDDTSLNISNCYVIADVTGLSNTGGFVGTKILYSNLRQYGSIKDNYFNGSVTGTTNVGGILKVLM